jgi:NAD dependent epimerase/dehydratase family enzyme
MSWIHLEDLTGLMLHAAGEGDLSGPVNAVAPSAVTNVEFTKALAAALHRPAVLPVPSFMLRLIFGEMADVLLGSQRVVPRTAEKIGYRFEFENIGAALRAIV